MPAVEPPSPRSLPSPQPLLLAHVVHTEESRHKWIKDQCSRVMAGAGADAAEPMLTASTAATAVNARTVPLAVYGRACRHNSSFPIAIPLTHKGHILTAQRSLQGQTRTNHVPRRHNPKWGQGNQDYVRSSKCECQSKLFKQHRNQTIVKCAHLRQN
eukprot:scaffold55285_cov23-Tisochrysis_lutea.AAC.1